MIAGGLLGRLRRPGVPHGRFGVGGRRARPAGRSLPRLHPKVVLAAVALLLALGGGWLWLRDSSLVAVKRVIVTGDVGPEAAQIRSALVAAARNMTTLDVRIDQLKTAVAPYPVVKDLQVSTQFPHGLRIRVIEQHPVGAVVAGGRTIAVAGDGTLLHDFTATGSLPQIPVKVPPGGARLSDPSGRGAVALLAAAPGQLLARISQVTTVATHGLVAQLRSGPSIYFGDPQQLAMKWRAVTAVLADPGSAGALYIDVTDPARPAAGASGSTSSGTSGSMSSGSTSSGSTSSGTSGSTSSSASAGAGGAAASGTAGSTSSATSSGSAAGAGGAASSGTSTGG